MIVGIDFGTSTSAVACLGDDGEPEILVNAEGDRLTPSAVYFEPGSDRKLVGARALAAEDPGRTVRRVKRLIDDPDQVWEFDGRQWTPAEVAALVFSKLKRDAREQMGPFYDVVLTVPANFNELARRNLVAAATMAGLNVVRLVNEPTAAALYYAHAHGVRGRVLVYDLGGGTLDVTIMDVTADGVRILTSEGARHLGGTDFDDLLLEVYADRCRKLAGIDLMGEERLRWQGLDAAEQIKWLLSEHESVASGIGSGDNGEIEVELTRDLFEEVVERQLLRSMMLVEQALDSAGIRAQDLDHVCLAGGSTRIPMVRQLLERTLGKAPEACENVEECVALGAALFAGRGGGSVKDVANTSYGTLALICNAETGEERLMNRIVIHKDTPLPCEFSQTFETSEDDEQDITVDITQGEDEDPRYVDVVGRVSLQVPPGRPAGCRISVFYRYDTGQRVHATIVDHDSGLSHQGTIVYQGRGILSESEIRLRGSYLRELPIE